MDCSPPNRQAGKTTFELCCLLQESPQETRKVIPIKYPWDGVCHPWGSFLPAKNIPSFGSLSPDVVNQALFLCFFVFFVAKVSFFEVRP
jgi:hypothetical protein